MKAMVVSFTYARSPTRWGESNYSNRFKVLEVRL